MLVRALAGIDPGRRAALLREQSLSRLLFATAGLAYLALHVPGFPRGAAAFLAVAVGYYAFNLFWLLAARRGRAPRQVVVLAPVLDVLVTSYGIVLDGGVGSGVFFVYFIIAFGNAYRWGPALLAWSQGLALAAHIGVAGALTALRVPWDATLWIWETIALLAVPLYALQLEQRRRRLASELAESERSLVAVVEHGPMPMFVFAVEETGTPRIRFANAAAAALAGTPPQELAGRTPDVLVLPEDGPELLAFCSRIAREPVGGRPRMIHLRARRDRQGRLRRLLCAGARVHLPGEAGGVVHLLDVTAHEEEAEIMRSAQNREALLAVVGGLLHEFRNTLAQVMGTAEILRMEARTQEAAHMAERIVEIAERSAGDLRDTLARLRHMAREAHGAGEPPSLDDIRETVAAARMQAPPEVRIRCALPERIPPLAIGRGELDQALFNLLTNAIAAIKGAGDIVVEGRIVERRGRPWLQLSVRDTGRGIAPEDLPHIFEPFWTSRAGDGGTGLGLAMVQAVVERAGGGVQVQSEPGRGTTFTLELPARGGLAGPAPQPPKPPREAPAVPPAGKALVVDDLPEVRAMLTGMLRRAGVRDIVTAADGEEAWCMLMESPGSFDLVLTDLRMPRLDGAELVERIRALRPDLPVVLLTAHADEAGGIEKARRRRAAVAWKPISYPMLLEAVAAARALAASARAEKSG